MSAQSEALRLANLLDNDVTPEGIERDAAAELRRLWAENEAIKAERDEDRRREYGYSQQVVDALTKERDVLRAQRDALLAARKAYDQWADKTFCYDRELRPIRVQIRAAIKAAEENT